MAGVGADPTPFELSVPADALVDLSRRLGATRWLDQPFDTAWDYGTDVGYLRELVAYWQDGFDWRARQDELNGWSHHRVGIGGIDLHFVIEPGEGEHPRPLLLLHGWPGTFVEMLRLVPLLTRPSEHGGSADDSFTVVVPSLPGYGFSSAPTAPGCGYEAMADLFHELMVERLGFERYGAYGTDVGGSVAGWLALRHPESVVGIATLEPEVPRPSLDPPAAPPSPDEARFLQRILRWRDEEGAYSSLHATKPSTIGLALADSPVGLAAWLVEKYRSWSDCGGNVETRYSKDDLLTIVSLYWHTGTAGSSLRSYRESRLSDHAVRPDERTEVPAGVVLSVDVPAAPPRGVPREYVERKHPVAQWSTLPSGGHFASWEEPQLVAESIRSFFRLTR